MDEYREYDGGLANIVADSGHEKDALVAISLLAESSPGDDPARQNLVRIQRSLHNPKSNSPDVKHPGSVLELQSPPMGHTNFPRIVSPTGPRVVGRSYSGPCGKARVMSAKRKPPTEPLALAPITHGKVLDIPRTSALRMIPLGTRYRVSCLMLLRQASPRLSFSAGTPVTRQVARMQWSVRSTRSPFVLHCRCGPLQRGPGAVAWLRQSI